METTAIGKSFMKNRLKRRNSFLQTSIKISENFCMKHLLWSKTDSFKETKKRDSKERYSTNFSGSRTELYC